MTYVWILTLLLGGGIHHYGDNGIFASQEKCETVLAVMKASHQADSSTQDTICRKVAVYQ